MIGNGSSSSEKIASLIRRGFDLDLVDQLGIESKGFSTMPELGAHREAPGMLWALRETGRVFGYTNFTLNACNEYVFRPERKVPRSWSRREIMKVTDYTLRDYLISLAWGCDIISTGHLEDCNDAYYDTNWGAGGQCKFYPYSYPKRMFTGLAVLTRALDCPRFMRRVPNGEISSYVLEFQRIRRTPDWAYACWTPCYSAKVAMKFPKSATVRVIRWDGREGKLKLDDRSCVHIPIGSTPCYVISSEQITGCKVEAHMAEQPPKNAVVIARTTAGNTQDPARPHFFDPNPCGIPFPPLARFKRRTVKDPELKTDVLEVELVPDGDMPLLRWEAGNAQFEKPPKFKLSEVEGIGVWVKGNGSFGKIRLSLKMAERHTGYPWDVAPGGGHGTVCFDGWQFMYARLEGRPKNFETSRCNEVMLDAILFGTARKALDPIAMADVTNHLRIGPVVIVPKGSSKDHGDTQCRQAEAVMKTVDDKDL